MTRIDPSSPVPLYHQIAQLIRAQIESGEVEAGDTLHPLREAAAAWDVNFHTVRHAYAELARQGLVEPRGPLGTRVLAFEPKTEAAKVPQAKVPQAKVPLDDARAVETHRDRTGSDTGEKFLTEMVARARNELGWSAEELAKHLAALSAAAPRPRVYVLECSDHQCQDLSQQIDSVWDVEAVPWCLDHRDLPEGHLVATHFHYNEIRLRWPQRLGGTLFVPISPAASLPDEIARRTEGRENVTLTLCERDLPTAEAVAADLSVLLPATEPSLRTEVFEGATEGATESSGRENPFEDIEGDLLLLPPRIWGSLSAEQKQDPRLVEIRYLYDTQELEATARRLSWPRTKPEEPSGLASQSG